MKSATDILNEAKSKPSRSDLSAHIDTIAVLRNKNYTWREIAEFFNEQGIEVDHTKVYRLAVANSEKINSVVNEGVSLSKSIQSKIPTAAEYVNALVSINISDNQKKMLGSHFHAHNRSITYTELANSAGAKSHVVANSQYGKLARELGEKLNFQFLKSKTRDAFFYSSAIGTDNPNLTEDDKEYQLIMHHELAKALSKLGWFSEDNSY